MVVQEKESRSGVTNFRHAHAWTTTKFVLVPEAGWVQRIYCNDFSDFLLIVESDVGHRISETEPIGAL